MWKTSKLAVIYDDSLSIVQVSFFVVDVNFLSYKLDSFIFTLLQWVIFKLILYQTKENWCNSFTLLLLFLEKNPKEFLSLLQELETLLKFLLDLDLQ